MKEKEYLGSYTAMDGRELTYYSEYDQDDGYYITQYTKAEKYGVDLYDSGALVRELLTHIEKLEYGIWEEAEGANL